MLHAVFATVCVGLGPNFAMFLLLIYVAGIFTVMNIYIECKLRVQTEQLRLLASTDPLTKLYNRREMLSRLNSISSSGCVIGIGDIDDFKKVNDTYGHDKGDEVLSTGAHQKIIFTM